MTPFEKAQRAYLNDPTYNKFVDYLVSFMHQLQMTPSEIREACMFACMKFQQSIDREDYERIYRQKPQHQ